MRNRWNRWLLRSPNQDGWQSNASEDISSKYTVLSAQYQHSSMTPTHIPQPDPQIRESTQINYEAQVNYWRNLEPLRHLPAITGQGSMEAAQRIAEEWDCANFRMLAPQLF